MNNIIILIIGMGFVTYIPRVAPLLALTDREISYKFKEFLTFIPYTSLTILIVKGILSASQEMRMPTIVGIGVSALISYFQGSLVLSVLGGIVSSFIAINIFM